ncbi:hypothetical protein I0P70_03540 [Pontibacter sp. FD36]|uniref:hypothetical protein n=1 Tax=Pontibacter sp. FD36 TaxID=2789860 RepID=UPI0018A8984D|nr:hypothetical protein [Pontibacter sp. FD36]MBF8962310.1 hypothetical protein [Pontibacter sp. FD36]
MKEIKENEVTVVRVNTATREKLNRLRKEISKNTRLNISTDYLINMLLDGFDHQKIRSMVNVF